MTASGKLLIYAPFARAAELVHNIHLAKSDHISAEALVSGTPIVGYRSAFPQDLIAAHGGGLLVPLDDVAALTEGVTGLARDRAGLAALIGKAAEDGAPFDDESVFRHRSELIRQYL